MGDNVSVICIKTSRQCR